MCYKSVSVAMYGNCLMGRGAEAGLAVVVQQLANFLSSSLLLLVVPHLAGEGSAERLKLDCAPLHSGCA